MESANSELETRTAEVESLRSSLLTKQNDLDEQTAKIDLLRSELRTLNDQNGRLTTTIGELERNLANRETAISEIRTAMNVEEGQDVAMAASEIATASEVSSAALDELRSEVASRDDNLDQLNSELVTLRESNDQLSSELVELRESNDQLSSELVVLRDNNAPLSSELNGLRESNGQLSSELNDLREGREKLDKQIASLRKQLNALAVANTSMYNDMKAMEKRVSVDSPADVDVLQAELREKTAEAAQLRTTLDNIREQLEADGIELPFSI